MSLLLVAPEEVAEDISAENVFERFAQRISRRRLFCRLGNGRAAFRVAFRTGDLKRFAVLRFRDRYAKYCGAPRALHLSITFFHQKLSMKDPAGIIARQ